MNNPENLKYLLLMSVESIRFQIFFGEIMLLELRWSRLWSFHCERKSAKTISFIFAEFIIRNYEAVSVNFEQSCVKKCKLKMEFAELIQLFQFHSPSISLELSVSIIFHCSVRIYGFSFSFHYKIMLIYVSFQNLRQKKNFCGFWFKQFLFSLWLFFLNDECSFSCRHVSCEIYLIWVKQDEIYVTANVQHQCIYLFIKVKTKWNKTTKEYFQHRRRTTKRHIDGSRISKHFNEAFNENKKKTQTIQKSCMCSAKWKSVRYFTKNKGRFDPQMTKGRLVENEFIKWKTKAW